MRGNEITYNELYGKYSERPILKKNQSIKRRRKLYKFTRSLR